MTDNDLKLTSTKNISQTTVEVIKLSVKLLRIAPASLPSDSGREPLKLPNSPSFERLPKKIPITLSGARKKAKRRLRNQSRFSLVRRARYSATPGQESQSQPAGGGLARSTPARAEPVPARKRSAPGFVLQHDDPAQPIYERTEVEPVRRPDLAEAERAHGDTDGGSHCKCKIVPGADVRKQFHPRPVWPSPHDDGNPQQRGALTAQASTCRPVELDVDHNIAWHQATRTAASRLGPNTGQPTSNSAFKLSAMTAY